MVEHICDQLFRIALMGLLDRLRREAGAARDRRKRAAAERAASSAENEARAAPAVARARAYFDDLCRQLNDIDRVVVAEYAVADLGRLSDLEQGGYELVEDPGEAGRSFRLSFRCTGKQGLEATVGGEAVAAALERDLRSAGVVCRRRELGHARHVVQVAPEVPVTIELLTDESDGAVRLLTRNLQALGRQRYRFEPERVDEVLLEAIANCILRQPSRLAELSGDTVNNAQRAELRKQLERERRTREAELGGAFGRLVFPVAEWFRRTFLGK